MDAPLSNAYARDWVWGEELLVQTVLLFDLEDLEGEEGRLGVRKELKWRRGRLRSGDSSKKSLEFQNTLYSFTRLCTRHDYWTFILVVTIVSLA